MKYINTNKNQIPYNTQLRSTAIQVAYHDILYFQSAGLWLTANGTLVVCMRAAFCDNLAASLAAYIATGAAA